MQVHSQQGKGRIPDLFASSTNEPFGAEESRSLFSLGSFPFGFLPYLDF